MFKLKFSALLLIVVFGFTSCKKDDDNKDETATSTEVLTDFSKNVAQATYNDLSTKAKILKQLISTFNTTSNLTNLNACREQWKTTRSSWEQSEGFLFGPVSSDDIDPRIDTWPVDYNNLDSVLSGSSTINAAYINGLEESLKGFHPIEYLLWGSDGNKQAADFTSREKDYLISLAENIETLTADLAASWVPGAANSYNDNFINAGTSLSTYSSQKAAFVEIVSAMAGICDEVANGKIEEPFFAQDPSLEESPFSKNSIIDFKNNIQSVKNVYYGKYSSGEKSLKMFVRTNNLSLDNSIEQKLTAALASLDAITLPFGQAIIDQPTQVSQAQVAINELKDVLETDLMAHVQLYVTK